MENFRELLLKIEGVIAARTINHPKVEKMAAYSDGDYNPHFSFAFRDDKLICIWCGNLIKPDKKHPDVVPDKEIWVHGGESEPAKKLRHSESRLREGFTPEEWDSLGLAIQAKGGDPCENVTAANSYL